MHLRIPGRITNCIRDQEENTMCASEIPKQVLLGSALVGLLFVACSSGKQERPEGPAPASTPTAAKTNTAPPTGWIDVLDGEPKVGGTIHLRGWAADPDDGAPVQKIEVTIDDRVVALANPLNLPRPDVVAATHRDNWLNAGWGAEVRMTGVFPGKHKLSAVAYDSQGAKAELHGGREIEVLAGQ
jgi:hypothetical protein